MPVRPGLADALWTARSPQRRLETDPALAYFRPWFRREARATYTRYLVSHPHLALVEPLEDLPRLYGPSSAVDDVNGLPIEFFRPPGFRDSLPRGIAAALYVHEGRVVIAWILIAVAAAAGFWLARLASRVWLVPVVALLSTFPLAVVVWVGDPTSQGRHALQLAIYARLGVLLLAVFALDAVAATVRLRPLARLTAPPQ
jgi:hypothetical protein